MDNLLYKLLINIYIYNLNQQLKVDLKIGVVENYFKFFFFVVWVESGDEQGTQMNKDF
jgi:hypothetical protein